MKTFREEEHPRDNDGKFTSKGGNTVDSLIDKQSDTPSEDKVSMGIKNSINKYNPQFQSKVFEKISSVKKKLQKNGSAIITLVHNGTFYLVRLYGADKDYDYDIIGEK